jgi:hypothetical protein
MNSEPDNVLHKPVNKHSLHYWEIFPDYQNDCPQENDTLRTIPPFRSLLLLFFQGKDVWGEEAEISTEM